MGILGIVAGYRRWGWPRARQPGALVDREPALVIENTVVRATGGLVGN